MSHDLEAQVAAVGTLLYVTFLYVVYQDKSYCGEQI